MNDKAFSGFSNSSIVINVLCVIVTSWLVLRSTYIVSLTQTHNHYTFNSTSFMELANVIHFQIMLARCVTPLLQLFLSHVGEFR